MHENRNNFHRLWMTTAGNLSVEIRYQKLKINFNYCFRHVIFQNQVYNFFWYYFLGRFVLQFNRKICLFFFSEFLDIRMFAKNSILALQILEKKLHVFVWSTLHKSRQTLSYIWKFTWEKTLAKQKDVTRLKSVLFINITKDLQYYILPRYAWSASFLQIRPARAI